MTIYDDRPWQHLYPADIPHVLASTDETGLSLFRDTVARVPQAPCIHYFDETISFEQLDRESDAVAAALVRGGVRPGARVAVYLQNDPQFAVGQLAAWKAGATMVSVNPMLKGKELRYILDDSGAVALVVLEDLYRDVAREVLPQTGVRLAITTRPADWAGASAALVPSSGPGADGAETGAEPPPGVQVEDMRAVVDAWDGTGAPANDPSSEDIALLVYTSGTSGVPKGVMTTHTNLAFNSEVYRRWMSIGPDDVFFAGAPLFHITGLVAGLALSYRSGMPIVLCHRFEPGLALRLCEQWRCTFTVMVITAFTSLMDHPDATTRDLSMLDKAYSGGAPVSPVVSNAWRQLTGSQIHNVYGLTETTSPSHAWPLGVAGPVDAESGALSVGVPVPSAEVRVVDAQTGTDAAVGDPGEIWIRGPMVTPGYWQRPDANTESFVDGYLRTGDVGKMDADGWFFIVDRLKDMINVSGYKVWPREVEDGLYEHPGVKEAAVVGVPDPYRGETVKAFVTLKSGATATPEELIEFCRSRMAAYKYPRSIEILDELPKTASGKVLRRELRDQPGASR